MRILAAILCAWTLTLSVQAQDANITALEYYIDADPGVGNGTAISFASGPDITASLNINTTSIALGFHVLVIRAEDENGVWSIQESRPFFVTASSTTSTANVTQMEYFLDSDPGFGNGTSLSITTGTTVTKTENISTTSLSPGFHVLHVRSMDSDGIWGLREARAFFVALTNVQSQSTITELEYFFDTDPGYDNGTAIPITSAASLDIQSLIASASLPAGFHTIHIRAKDSDGTWGLAQSRAFFTDGVVQISGIEYYFDTDPGEGSATQVLISPAQANVDINVTIPGASVTSGSHTLGVRASRTDGLWGSTQTLSFTIKDTQTITFNALAARTYGDAPFDLTASASSGLAISYASSDPAVATVSGTTVTIIGAGTTTITASQPGDTNFDAAPDVSQTLTIVKAGQIISFATLSAMTYGDAPFNLTASASSGQAVSYASSDPAVATVSGATVTIVGAGTTTITASQPGDTNFEAAPDVIQTLTVNKANQTITFDPIPASVLLGDPDLTLSATSTSGLTVSFTSSNTTVATVSGNTVVIVGAGTTDITAIQAGDSNYNAASDEVQSLVVVNPNTAPSMSSSSPSVFFGNTSVIINGTLTITDTDTNLQSASVSITAGYQSAEDQLIFSDQNGIVGSFDSGSGTLSLTGASSVANYQTALRSVQYGNTASTPSTADRTVTFLVNDGSELSNAITTIVSINRPPEITAEPQTTNAGGFVSFSIASIFSDPDNNLDPASITVVSSQGATVTISGNEIIIDYSNVPDFDGTDTLVITICDLAGQCRTENIDISVESEIIVYNGISPNEDTANDYFKIRYLPAGSKVTIYNRWGDLVFDMTDYTNSDPARRFSGLSNDGNELPTGTYFYRIHASDGRELEGYLVLKR